MTTPAEPAPARSNVDSATTRGMAEAMASTGVDQSSVRRRWGIVRGINNADSTLNVEVGGVIINKMKRLATYAPTIGERVQIDVVVTDMVVVGSTAPSPRNQSLNQRIATVTGINANNTLKLTLDGGASVDNIVYLASYRPSLNESVRVVQSGNDATYLVLGALSPSPRMYRRPVGDIEQTFLKTPKPDTLLLDGRTLKRADYPALWSWINANGLTTGSGFGAGDGSTTFVIPDMRGVVTIGAGTRGANTYALGAITGAPNRTLVTANMPAHKHDVAVAAHTTHKHDVAVAAHTTHKHDVSVASHATHDHNVAVATHANHDHAASGSTGGGGGHSHGVPMRHNANPSHEHNGFGGTTSEAANNSLSGASCSTFGAGEHSHSVSVNVDTASGGSHSVTGALTGPTTHSVTEALGGPTTHSVTEALGGPTTHAVTEATIGGTTPVDIRQESIAVNWLIWH